MLTLYLVELSPVCVMKGLWSSLYIMPILKLLQSLGFKRNTDQKCIALQYNTERKTKLISQELSYAQNPERISCRIQVKKFTEKRDESVFFSLAELDDLSSTLLCHSEVHPLSTSIVVVLIYTRIIFVYDQIQGRVWFQIIG